MTARPEARDGDPSAIETGRSAHGSRAWKVLVLVVLVVAGLLLAITRTASHGNELRSSDSGRLSDLVRAAQTDSDSALRERDALADRVAQMQRDVATSDREVADLLAQSDDLTASALLAEQHGTGVVVTLTDAARDTGGNYPADATPDDLVVHQQDVQSALNALWAGGASAIGMQDQRIVGTSAPRCIGNTLLLHGRTYSPPYRLIALGDPTKLLAALDAEPGVRTFRQYVAKYGLGFAVEVRDDLTVPAETDPSPVRFAQPAR
ncbi:DUF881 domain-containing protein [Aldersonia sp. NBC_00410]|uniref:DUF881 domain-containing protein n=1 Tax=Aldersonia sp. NBC_00410 TaxID=2975954 RepID=UPI00224D32E9|nr:DUF881 domain-containing protein [Aldersonia sp. NBC_00410]MCX5045038.1 DUF881 domain-containing protein [Aldersonia sp. NBC_00410]